MFPRFKLVHKDLHKLGLPQRKYIEVFYFIGATFNFKTCVTKDFKLSPTFATFPHFIDHFCDKKTFDIRKCMLLLMKEKKKLFPGHKA